MNRTARFVTFFIVGDVGSAVILNGVVVPLLLLWWLAEAMWVGDGWSVFHAQVGAANLPGMMAMALVLPGFMFGYFLGQTSLKNRGWRIWKWYFPEE